MANDLAPERIAQADRMTLKELAARARKLADWERDDPYGSGDHQWLLDIAAKLADLDALMPRIQRERDFNDGHDPRLHAVLRDLLALRGEAA